MDSLFPAHDAQFTFKQLIREQQIKFLIKS